VKGIEQHRTGDELMKFRWSIGVGLLFVIAFGLYAVSLTAAQETPTVLEFDIAENHTHFVFDETPIHEEDQLPAYGGEFVTQGYIYPPGTLNGSNGVLENGEPEFPDKVIGEWTCRGWHIGDGAHTTTGNWVATTQIYQLNEDYGNAIIVTDGFESPENTVIARAITGGTGMFSSARGEQTQSLMGFTDFFGVNLHVELNVTE
jgi:hypothetical protein